MTFLLTEGNAICIFADDVRQEIGNKISVIGQYGDDMIFPGPPPGGIQKLAVVLYLKVPVDDVPSKLRLRVTAPAHEGPVAKVEMETAGLANGRYPDAHHYILTFGIPIQPILVTEPGFIEVFADIGMGEIKAGRLRVAFQQTE